MAFVYTLEMETDADAESVRTRILASDGFTRFDDALNGDGVHVTLGRIDPNDRSDRYYRQVSLEDFGIAPDIVVVFRIDKFERREAGEQTAIALCLALSHELSVTARVTVMHDFAAFVRRGGALVLDAAWAAAHRDCVERLGEPYTTDDLRGADAARQAANG